MENLAPILVDLDVPTKKYVDDAARQGFSAQSARWGPAWPSAKSLTTLDIPSYWIYAYRVVSRVSISMLSVENLVASTGNICIAVYADSYPWPGAQLVKSSNISTNAAGFKSAALSIAAGNFWLAIHNVSTVTIPMRTVTNRNPYSPGSLTSTGVNFLDSGFGYNVGSATTPATWPAGTGTDATGIGFYLRAT